VIFFFSFTFGTHGLVGLREGVLAVVGCSWRHGCEEGKARYGACIRSYGLSLGFERRNGGWVACGTSQRNDVLYHLSIICMVYNTFPLDFWYDTLSRVGWGGFFYFLLLPVFLLLYVVFLSFVLCVSGSLYSTQDTAGAGTDRLICWSFVVEDTTVRGGRCDEACLWGRFCRSLHLLIPFACCILYCVCVSILGIELMGDDSDHWGGGFPIYFYFNFFASSLYPLWPSYLPSRIFHLSLHYLYLTYYWKGAFFFFVPGAVGKV